MRNNAMYFLKKMRDANVHVVLVELVYGEETEFIFIDDAVGATETSAEETTAGETAEDAAAGETAEDAAVGTEGESGDTTDDVPPLPTQIPNTVLQYRVNDVMHYKDIAMNIALKNLPEDCECVCWCDCDIVFEDSRWADIIYTRVKQYGTTLLQAFHTACLTDDHLRRTFLLGEHRIDCTAADADTSEDDESVCKSSDESVCKSSDESLLDEVASFVRDPEIGAPGFCWAAPREKLVRIGFFPYCVVGDGCHLHACTLTQRESFARQQIVNYYRRDAFEPLYRQYQQKIRRSGIQQRIEFLELRLYHLYHGESSEDIMRNRYLILQRRQFNPLKSLRKIPKLGLYNWTAAFRSTGVNDDILDSLHRDGTCKSRLWRSRRMKLNKLNEIRHLLNQFMQLEHNMLQRRTKIGEDMCHTGKTLQKFLGNTRATLMR